MSFGVLDGDGQVAQIEGHPFGRISFTGARFAQADVRLLSPILPSKVVCVGKNYAEHIAEMNTGDAPKEPLLFLKPSTVGHRPGRRHPHPAGQHERAPRGRTGRRHRCARGPPRDPRAGRGQHLRLHDRQRRHRAGHAEERRAVDPRQGLRLLLPDRAVDRDRPARPRPGPGRPRGHLHRRRRAAPAGPHQPADLRRPDPDLLHLPGHDAAARRRRPDRHAVRRRADPARASGSTSRSRGSAR